MTDFLSKLTNFVALILLASGGILIAVKLFKPQLFKAQDIILVVAFFLAALLVFWFGGHYSIAYKKEPQYTLALLTLPAVFYTWEMVRMRDYHPKNRP